MAALEGNTARLPVVEIVKPSEVLGCSTVESIQSGLYYGRLATVEWLISSISKQHFPEHKPVVVGTGGYRRLFEEERLFDAFLTELG